MVGLFMHFVWRGEKAGGERDLGDAVVRKLMKRKRGKIAEGGRRERPIFLRF